MTSPSAHCLPSASAAPRLQAAKARATAFAKMLQDRVEAELQAFREQMLGEQELRDLASKNLSMNKAARLIRCSFAAAAWRSWVELLDYNNEKRRKKDIMRKVINLLYKRPLHLAITAWIRCRAMAPCRVGGM